jgi:hypothetical protein
MTKEERERKEAIAKAEWERRMEQLRSTMPPSDDRLLKSVAEVALSPPDVPGETKASLPLSVPLEIGTPLTSKAQPPSLPEASERGGGQSEGDLVEQPMQLEGSAPAVPPSQRAAARVYASNDPKLEALLDAIAQQVRARRRHRSGVNRKGLVIVDSDTFSRVSHVSHARRLDKVEVLTYLLSRYLPEAGKTEAPAWLLQERSDEILNSFHLVYHDDAAIAERFDWLELRFGLLKVDIVAAIVSRYLPPAPFAVPPKRRRRRMRL